MIGDLARQDDYYDPMTGIPIGGTPAEPDPRESMPLWARQAAALPASPVEPQVGMWPDYKPPKQLPDVGPPVIPSGPSWQGSPAANRMSDVASQLAYQYAVPSSPLDVGLMVPGGAVAKGVGALLGGVLNSDEAEAGKAAAAKKAIGKLGEILGPAHKTETDVEQLFARPSVTERYVTDPQRIYKPGIYKDPREIAAEANAMVAPEHPALKQLFGVTRQDLYDISQQGTRQGNVAPNIWQPAKPGISYAAANIMNPANAQRLVDTLTEARKYPGLEQGMVPWYVMDPAFHRLVALVGPERAITEYNRFNSIMTPFSASSDVMKEINRGTTARMMADKGQFPDFVKYGGMPVGARPAEFPQEMTGVIPHLRHETHTDPVTRYLETGRHGYGENTVKIPLYTQASGVPETGFQTAWPVPDAHFTRAVGMSDVRKNAGPGNFMEGPEYRTMAPWFRENVAQPLGLEGVPTQALTWGTYAPQTGVKTTIGAGKLELLSQRIWERAQQLGVDPSWFRDQVLLGKEHAELDDDRGMGSLAAQNKYA